MTSSGEGPSSPTLQRNRSKSPHPPSPTSNSPSIVSVSPVPIPDSPSIISVSPTSSSPPTTSPPSSPMSFKKQEDSLLILSNPASYSAISRLSPGFTLDSKQEPKYFRQRLTKLTSLWVDELKVFIDLFIFIFYFLLISYLSQITSISLISSSGPTLINMLFMLEQQKPNALQK